MDPMDLLSLLETELSTEKWVARAGAVTLTALSYSYESHTTVHPASHSLGSDWTLFTNPVIQTQGLVTKAHIFFPPNREIAFDFFLIIKVTFTVKRGLYIKHF